MVIAHVMRAEVWAFRITGNTKNHGSFADTDTIFQVVNGTGGRSVPKEWGGAFEAMVSDGGFLDIHIPST